MTTIAVNIRFVRPDLMEGMGIHTYEVLKRLIHSDLEVDWHVISDPQLKRLPEELRESTWHRVFPPARHPVLFKWWYNYSVPRILNKIQADLFWSPDNFCSLRTPVPQLLTIHDLAYLHYPDFIPDRILRYYQSQTPRFIDIADHIMTVSETSARDIQNKFNKSADDITVCYNGSRDLPKPLSGEEKQNIKRIYTQGEDYFIYIGSFHPRKNIASLIKAFDIFKKDDTKTKLVLAGRSAWQTSDVADALNQSPFKSDIIHIDKYINAEEVAHITAAALGFCYVSLFEGFGLSIIESMSAGTPVITSDRGAMKEVGGDAVILVNPESADSIANGLRQMHQDERLRNDLIKRGHEQAQKFSWDKTANIYRSVIERYLN